MDRDADNVLFHYGNNPNFDLTVFGACNLAPAQQTSHSDSLFNSAGAREFNEQANQFSAAFDQIFDAIAPLENVENFASYPHIMLYPFAVYRTMRGDED